MFAPAYANNTKNYTCWDYAGEKFNVDPWLLFSIAAVESGFTPNIKSKNTNKTYDLGLMQINTIHIPYFEKKGISEKDLQHDSCKGIIAGAYILKQNINKYGYNIDGIGAYHSRTPALRKKYGKKVIKKYNELVKTYFINKKPFSFESYKYTKPVQNQSQYQIIPKQVNKQIPKKTESLQSSNNKQTKNTTMVLTLK